MQTTIHLSRAASESLWHAVIALSPKIPKEKGCTSKHLLSSLLLIQSTEHARPTTRLSQGRSKPSPSHNRPPAGESEIGDCKGRKNKQAPKEVKTSQKSTHHRVPESQPFLIFPLAIPHSFRFHSSSIMQLAQSRKQLSTLFGYSTPHEPIILTLVRVVQRFDAVIAPLYSYGVARVIP
jgi:hypothetical protein